MIAEACHRRHSRVLPVLCLAVTWILLRGESGVRAEQFYETDIRHYDNSACCAKTSMNDFRQIPISIDIVPTNNTSRGEPGVEEPWVPVAENMTGAPGAAVAQALSGAWAALGSGTPAAAVGERCRREMSAVWHAAQRLDLWALRMLDSSAKMPAGLLGGNVNQLGDFDQCLGAAVDSDAPRTGRKLPSRYCLVSVDLRLRGAALHKIDDLLHSHYFMHSDLHDAIAPCSCLRSCVHEVTVMIAQFRTPTTSFHRQQILEKTSRTDVAEWSHAVLRGVAVGGHRIARQTEFRWGVCLPSGCTALDAERAVLAALAPIAATDVASVRVRADRALCSHRRPTPLSYRLGIGFILFLVLLTLVASWQDKGALQQRGGFWARALGAFSLRRNVFLLLDTRTPPGDIHCLHGVRFLNAFALLLFHKSAALQYEPLLNRTRMAQILSMPWAVIGRTSVIYTDTFLLLSGFLSTYQMTRRMDRGERLSFVGELAARVFRILPSLVAVVLFCTYVLPHLGTGPQWGLVVDTEAELCRQYMWRNFLFIHNFFEYPKMCLSHTHHLGIDMQLFAVTPALVALLYLAPRRGMALLVVLAIASTFLRFAVAMRHGLSTVVYFGATVSMLFRTANLSYTQASHRATVYLMGVIVGYGLRRLPNEKLTLSKRQVLSGWSVALVLGLLAMCGPVHMGLQGYRFFPLHGALYTACAPIAWGTFVAWIILASVSGYAGTFGTLLEWRVFIIFSRLAYGVYLTQFPIYFYNVGLTRTSDFYSLGKLVNLPELVAVLLSAAVLTLLVEMPAQRLRNIWRGRSDQPKIKSDLNDQLMSCRAVPTTRVSSVHTRKNR